MAVTGFFIYLPVTKFLLAFTKDKGPPVHHAAIPVISPPLWTSTLYRMTPEFPYIAIVDDDPDDQEFLRAGMRRCFPEVTVMPFGNGNELLTYLDKCNNKKLPLAMILDYKMPGLSGADVLRITGNDTPYSSISKVVWSTSRLRKEMDECLALGALRWIVKPSTNDELDLAIRSLAPTLFKLFMSETSMP